MNTNNLDEYIGQKFGKLTITKIWRDKKKHEIRCVAKCDNCQQEKEFRFRSITSGQVKSCGCTHQKIDLESLVGQKFNRLTILKAVREKRGNDNHNQIYVQCKCDCGNITEVRLSSLKNNAIQSCGCLHKEIVAENATVNLDELIGQKFGKLTVIKAERKGKIDNTTCNRIRVQCQCECGAIDEYLYHSLKSRKHLMCKTCQSKHIKEKNVEGLNELIGQKFNKLTVLKAWRNERSEKYVEAKCECGNVINTRYRNLTTGQTKTCGKCELINLDELIGQKFGKLTIVEAKRKQGRVIVKAKCECDGNIKEYVYYCLKSGHTKSCGCNLKTAKGNSVKRLYRIWRRIQERCYNKKNSRYKDWGGRGITVCDEWLNSFEAFETWALANGYQDDLTIDRINNDDNYRPDNCRWATMKVQNNNKRNTLRNNIISIGDESHTVAEWCKKNNIAYGTFKSRRYKGVSMEEAVAPSKINKNKK